MSTCEFSHFSFCGVFKLKVNVFVLPVIIIIINLTCRARCVQLFKWVVLSREEITAVSKCKWSNNTLFYYVYLTHCRRSLEWNERFTGDVWLSVTAEAAQKQPVAEVWDKVCRTHMTACKSGFRVGKEFTDLENTAGVWCFRLNPGKV